MRYGNDMNGAAGMVLSLLVLIASGLSLVSGIVMGLSIRRYLRAITTMSVVLIVVAALIVWQFANGPAEGISGTLGLWMFLVLPWAGGHALGEWLRGHRIHERG